jgi:hypothetical protein
VFSDMQRTHVVYGDCQGLRVLMILEWIAMPLHNTRIAGALSAGRKRKNKAILLPPKIPQQTDDIMRYTLRHVLSLMRSSRTSPVVVSMPTCGAHLFGAITSYSPRSIG